MSPIRGRFDNAGLGELLHWARTYLESQLEMLERAHADEYGRIRPAETRVELKYLRDWIRRSAEVEAMGKRRLEAVLPPGATLEDALTKGYPANQA